jgi:predicted enzyme related to lactoylglutathione lyase
MVLIDVPRADYAAAVDFWQATLDRPAEAEAEDPDYTSFGEPTTGVRFTVQAVDDDRPRIHLDIETDDVGAEVARLTSLGATTITPHDGWAVMADPIGNPFCVVPVQVPDAFAASAVSWET